MIEYARLRWAMDHQKELTVDKYNRLTERRIVLPSTVVRGPRNMIRNYHDAMLYVDGLIILIYS